MSWAAHQRYIVSAFDYDLWQVVVEAGSREDAVRKAQAIYEIDGFGNTDAFTLLDRKVRWSAEPLVREVQP